MLDANGNLETVTDPLGGVTTFVYDSVDRLTEKHLPNGVVSAYTYDDRDRVLSVAHTGASGVLASVTYVRSASGEPTRITREDGSYVVLTYDAALRLDTETYYTSGGTLVDAIDYDYDFDGNRTRKTSLTGGVEDYSYSAGFRLNSVTKSGGTDTFGYDGGGRVTSIARDGATQTLTYNSDDKLTRVTGGATDVQYTYDGVGRRVAKVEGGSTTRYLVAPNLGDGFETPQAVTDGSGNVLASYVFAGEHPLMRIENGVATYYLQDAMGSVVGMADSAGASAGSVKYDGFGNVTSATGAAASIPPAVGWDFRLHGMALDATGLYHVRARTYDPRTGRFTTRDPVSGGTRRPESVNPYVFVYSSPTMFIDPSGQFGMIEIMAVAAITTTLAAIAIPTYTSYLKKARAVKAGSFYGRGLTSWGQEILERDLGSGDTASPDYWLALGAGIKTAAVSPEDVICGWTNIVRKYGMGQQVAVTGGIGAGGRVTFKIKPDTITFYVGVGPAVGLSAGTAATVDVGSLHGFSLTAGGSAYYVRGVAGSVGIDEYGNSAGSLGYGLGEGLAWYALVGKTFEMSVPEFVKNACPSQ